MIEDKFQFTEVTDDLANLLCKDCEQPFTANMNILTPKNCMHVLGESVTIMCPHCHIHATTTKKESDIVALELRIKDLEKFIDSNEHLRPLFNILEYNKALQQSHYECRKCSHRFKTNGALENEQFMQIGLFPVKCPACGTEDNVSKEKIIDRIQVILAMLRWMQAKELLAKLKGGDNSEYCI